MEIFGSGAITAAQYGVGAGIAVVLVWFVATVIWSRIQEMSDHKEFGHLPRDEWHDANKDRIRERNRRGL
jgi:hypothetical protein